MNTAQLSSLLPADFSNNSRAWVYQSSRPFQEKEVAEIDEQLHHFYTQWQSHGDEVKGWAKLLFHQFIVVLADEEATGVSGCSTDSMVRIIKSIERQYSVQLFDRLTLTFLVKDKAEMLPLQQVGYALEKGYLSPETPFFNNTITSKEQLLSQWIVPLKDSWLAARVGL